MGYFRMRSADTKWPTLRLQNYYFKTVELFLRVILSFFLFISDSWGACVNTYKLDYDQINADFKGKIIISRNLRISQVLWKSKIYCIWILWRIKTAQKSDFFSLFFCFTDYTNSSLKSEFLNDDGENYWIRAFYRSYTRLHRYVHFTE